jgi:hypothetical protein
VGSLLGEDGTGDGHDGVSHEHARSGRKEQGTTADTLDGERGDGGPEEVPNGEETVDEEDDGRVGDSNGRHDRVEEVREHTIAGPLREEGDGHNDAETLAVARGGEERLVANVGGDGTVELNGGLDLVVLELNERVLLVAVGVVVTKGANGIGVTTLGNEPTRGLGSEEDQADLQDGGNTLEDGRDTPRPRILDLEGTESRPGSAVHGLDQQCHSCVQDIRYLHNVTGEPERVVKRSERGTVRRVRNLGDQHGSRVGGKCETKADEETSTNEHADALRRGLEGGRDTHDGGTEEDGLLTTETIRQVRSERVSSERTNVLAYCEQETMKQGRMNLT